jgi:hypothetical protein
MTEPRANVAQLDQGQLNKLQALEKDVGTCLVAMEQETRFADLTEAQLKRLQAGEKDLGVILLAYECD